MLAKFTKKQKIIATAAIIFIVVAIALLQVFINRQTLAPATSPIPSLAPITTPSPASATTYPFLEAHTGDTLVFKTTVADFLQKWNAAPATNNPYADVKLSNVSSITDNGDLTSTYSYNLSGTGANVKLSLDLIATNSTTKISSVKFNDTTGLYATDPQVSAAFTKAIGLLSDETAPYAIAQNTWDVLQGSPEYINNGVWFKIDVTPAVDTTPASLSITAIPDEPMPNIEYTPDGNLKAALIAHKWEADNFSYILEYKDDGTYIIDYSQSPNNKDLPAATLKYRMSGDVVYCKNGKDAFQQKTSITNGVLTLTNVQTGGVSTCHRYYAPGEAQPSPSPSPTSSASPLPSHIR
jgi:hypothetical protein